MAGNQLLQTLTELNSKIEALILEQYELKNKIKELELRNLMLENQHTADLIKLEQAQKDIEFLSYSHRLADSPNTIISTRKQMLRLIGTINNCIRMLNEE